MIINQYVDYFRVLQAFHGRFPLKERQTDKALSFLESSFTMVSPKVKDLLIRKYIEKDMTDGKSPERTET